MRTTCHEDELRWDLYNHASPGAKDLARRIADLIVLYRQENPSATEADVLDALRLYELFALTGRF